jgi:hypothetical protein
VFADLFTAPSWSNVLVLLAGVILAPGRRTVTSALRILGRERDGDLISARGIYRDPVRSSKGHFVNASGLRWLSAMLLVRVPWANRIMALPFLTLLSMRARRVPKRRCSIGPGRPPCKSTAGFLIATLCWSPTVRSRP